MHCAHYPSSLTKCLPPSPLHQVELVEGDVLTLQWDVMAPKDVVEEGLQLLRTLP